MTENKPEANDTGVEPTRPEQHTATGMIIAAAVILLLMIGFAVAWFAITGKKKGEAKWVDPGRVENKKAAQPVPAVAWADVTAGAGISFSHTTGAVGKKLLPETMGAGVAVLDIDNDGFQDLFLVNSCPWPDHAGAAKGPCLMRNLGNGKFEDVTKVWGIDRAHYGMGACAADMDNDGFVDLFVTGIGDCRLYRNLGGKGFADVTTEAGLKEPVAMAWAALKADGYLAHRERVNFPSSATFVDYDLDGLVDLFVCSYVHWAPGIDLGIASTLTGDKRGYVSPRSFEGSQCRLFRNTGAGKFIDASEVAGVRVLEDEGVGAKARKRDVAKSLGVVAFDADNDGWPDLMVANDTVRNFFFHNEPDPAVIGGKGRKFVEKGLTQGAAYAEGQARAGMGIEFGEYLPGKSAVFVANFANEPVTFLAIDNTSTPPRFADRALAVGLAGPGPRVPMKFGASLLDFDLDGRLDLLLCNGHLEPDIGLVQASQAFPQAPRLFWNTGTQPRVFEGVEEAGDNAGLFKPMVGRGSASLDYDGDGDLDLVLTANGGPCRLVRNDQKLAHHYLRVRLEGDGKRCNRSALGAVARVSVGGVVHERVVAGARGYLCQPELVLTFGLGKATAVDWLEVKWPYPEAKFERVVVGEVDREMRVKQAGGG